MPFLKKIVVQDFRNIAFQELSFSPNVNCISGNNGEGKTNLLDAIYYLSMTKSAFAVPDSAQFRYGTEGFTLGGTYGMENGLESRFALKVSREGKKLVRDDKPYGRMGEHIGTLPLVMVSPGDIALVSESGEDRRRFANAVLSQMQGEYLAAVQSYTRLLSQRNKILKEASPDRSLLAVIDQRMEAFAAPVHEARSRLAADLQPVVAEYYRLISGGGESVSIEYKSELSNSSLSDIFERHLEQDLRLRYTSSGIQRDDFLFTMNGHPIRRAGSQGQQKSFLVALKFAQYEIMKRAYGYAPMLLLDDIFDKLDLRRISNLISMVAGADFGQIFLTDTDATRLSGIVDRITQDRAYYSASAGIFTRVE